MKKPPALRIGCTEYIDLPEWGIYGLKAKVDTGAETSALDAEVIERRADGTVAFDLMVQRRKHHHISHVIAPVVREGNVRSSTGDQDRRLFVETLIRLGDREARVEFSLVNRKPMRFRALLGRATLKACRVVIDPRRTYLLGKVPNEGIGEMKA